MKCFIAGKSSQILSKSHCAFILLVKYYVFRYVDTINGTCSTNVCTECLKCLAKSGKHNNRAIFMLFSNAVILYMQPHYATLLSFWDNEVVLWILPAESHRGYINAWSRTAIMMPVNRCACIVSRKFRYTRASVSSVFELVQIAPATFTLDSFSEITFLSFSCTPCPLSPFSFIMILYLCRVIYTLS